MQALFLLGILTKFPKRHIKLNIVWVVVVVDIVLLLWFPNAPTQQVQI